MANFTVIPEADIATLGYLTIKWRKQETDRFEICHIQYEYLF